MSEVLVVGSFVQDLAFHTAEFPNVGETRIGTFQAGPGGKGFNQAVACKRQRVSTSFIGAVGKDVFAQGLREFASVEELPLFLQEVDNASTGAASIVVDSKGRNQIIVDLGANNYLQNEFVQQCFEKSTDQPRVVLVQVEGNLDAAACALQLGRKSGAQTILNPAPLNPGITKELLSFADILTPNETEFAFLLRHFFEVEIPEEFWKLADAELQTYCRKLGNEIVIITLGSSGSFVSLPDDCFRVPAISVNTKDTTGAGDAFSGGLAAGLLLRIGDLREAVLYATVVAGLSTESAGTAPSMPFAEQVIKRLS